MTTATLTKHRTFTYNDKGKPVSVSLDLKNRMMRKFFETLMEDFQDTLTVMKRQDEDTISWEELKSSLDAKSII